ncbi:MAG: hypothetical protein GY931_06200 [Maribacter sp.]|nr:hypothetical protein [Maribacter sp.]
MQGYIKLHRKLVNWEWYDNPNTLRLFIHLLLKANHKYKKWQGISIERGSFITGYDKLASELNLSKQQIRTSIRKLKSTGEITHQPTPHYSVVTIVNYDSYQCSDNPLTPQATSKATDKQHTTNTQLTPTKNDENDKNDEEEDIIGPEETPDPDLTAPDPDLKTEFNFKKELLLLDVDPDTLDDWLIVRKNKKATNSQTAFNNLVSQITKSGLHPQQAIEMAASKSWAGFEAEWIKDDSKTYSKVTERNIKNIRAWLNETAG